MVLENSDRISEKYSLAYEENGYEFRLANGQGWYVSATSRLRGWADKLAAIMQLDSCEPNGYPKLIFIPKRSEKDSCEMTLGGPGDSLKEKLSTCGWKAQDISDMRLWSKTDSADVICEIGIGEETGEIVRMRHSLYPIYQRAQDLGGLPFHAGLVEREGKGVLLAAQRNTGKSTCCRRIPRPWQVLCDEETLIVRDNEKQYLGHPFPTWSDYLTKRSERTWDVRQHVPLAAILFLEKAKTDELISVGKEQAAVFIYQLAMQVCNRYWHELDRVKVRTFKKKLFDNACELARTIPAFKLRVSLKGRFWEQMEKALS